MKNNSIAVFANGDRIDLVEHGTRCGADCVENWFVEFCGNEESTPEDPHGQFFDFFDHIVLGSGPTPDLALGRALTALRLMARTIERFREETDPEIKAALFVIERRGP